MRSTIMGLKPACSEGTDDRLEGSAENQILDITGRSTAPPAGR